MTIFNKNGKKVETIDLLSLAPADDKGMLHKLFREKGFVQRPLDEVAKLRRQQKSDQESAMKRFRERTIKYEKRREAVLARRGQNLSVGQRDSLLDELALQEPTWTAVCLNVSFLVVLLMVVTRKRGPRLLQEKSIVER